MTESASINVPAGDKRDGQEKPTRRPAKGTTLYVVGPITGNLEDVRVFRHAEDVIDEVTRGNVTVKEVELQ